MAHLVKFFMLPDDELAFLRSVERHGLNVYPVRVPPDWAPFVAGAAVHARLPEEDLYLAAEHMGEVLVDKVKRGPEKGNWRVDETRSPVIFWERSRLNEDGELLSGKLWAELDITPQTGRKDAASDRFRVLFLEVHEWLKKAFRKGAPKEFLIGPHAARRVKEEGLVLRENVHRGGTVEVHR
jgi:hypothetical protein